MAIISDMFTSKQILSFSTESGNRYGAKRDSPIGSEMLEGTEIADDLKNERLLRNL